MWICPECDIENFDHMKSCIHCETVNPLYDKSKKQNCWDYMKCPEKIKQKCEAYIRDFGKECWLVIEEVGTGCYSYKKYNGCINCPFFRTKNLKLISELDF